MTLARSLKQDGAAAKGSLAEFAGCFSAFARFCIKAAVFTPIPYHLARIMKKMSVN
jgi:hypothetical protein